MTHYAVGIIVPQDRLTTIHEFVEGQMAPYDEDVRVAPYVCYSIDQCKSDIERDIQRFQRIIDRKDPNYNLEKCREVVDELRRTTPEHKYREYIRFHESFNAQGEPISTCNPKSKWDWYRIGGRWDGWITGNERSSEHGFNFGPEHETVANNIAPTERAIERGVIPHAIVTPDGQWHERGTMGWFAVLITENEDWDAQAKEILANHPGHHLLILDAHI
jgi:hypothetical protein